MYESGMPAWYKMHCPCMPKQMRVHSQRDFRTYLVGRFCVTFQETRNIILRHPAFQPFDQGIKKKLIIFQITIRVKYFHVLM